MLDPTPFASIRGARPELPAPLVAIIDRAVSKRADARFASAEELIAALLAAAGATRPRKVPGSAVPGC